MQRQCVCMHLTAYYAKTRNRKKNTYMPGFTYWCPIKINEALILTPMKLFLGRDVSRVMLKQIAVSLSLYGPTPH